MYGNKSKMLTWLSIYAGAVGILALIGAWLAGEEGQFLGMTQTHLYYDAITLLLVAIWLKLGAIYHKQ